MSETRDAKIMLVACELAGNVFRENNLSGHAADWVNRYWDAYRPLATRIVDALDKIALSRPAVDEGCGEAGLRAFADRLEKIALSIPAPNAYTPELVMMAQGLRAALSARGDQAGDGK